MIQFITHIKAHNKHQCRLTNWETTNFLVDQKKTSQHIRTAGLNLANKDLKRLNKAEATNSRDGLESNHTNINGTITVLVDFHRTGVLQLQVLDVSLFSYFTVLHFLFPRRKHSFKLVRSRGIEISA